MYLPKHPQQIILFMQVSYWKDSEQEESGKKQRTEKNETFLVLAGLEGNSQYLITVKGFNSIGQGPASAAITTKTKKPRECSFESNQVLLLFSRYCKFRYHKVKDISLFALQLLHSHQPTSCGFKKATTCL